MRTRTAAALALAFAVSLPAGEGRVFQSDMTKLLDELRTAIPKAFEENVYEQQKDEIVRSLQKQMEEKFAAVEEEAKQSGFTVKSVPPRLVLVPLQPNGEPMPQ